jgi:hypothetical protein
MRNLLLFNIQTNYWVRCFSSSYKLLTCNPYSFLKYHIFAVIQDLRPNQSQTFSASRGADSLVEGSMPHAPVRPTMATDIKDFINKRSTIKTG